jgi:hypothetical protein
VRAALLIACILALAVGGSAAQATTAKVHVTVVGQDHHPRVGKKWHYEVHVTLNGKPVAAFIHLQLLFHGVAVGEVGKHSVKNGFWQETFQGKGAFPAAARGQPLVLEATVTVKGHPVAKAGWSIVVQ